jgi:hypothetical protein
MDVEFGATLYADHDVRKPRHDPKFLHILTPHRTPNMALDARL